MLYIYKPVKPLIGINIYLCMHCLSNSNRGDSDPMSSQSLNILTVFNFAHILHTNSHPQEEQLCKLLLSYTHVSQYLKCYPGHCHHSLNNK